MKVLPGILPGYLGMFCQSNSIESHAAPMNIIARPIAMDSATGRQVYSLTVRCDRGSAV